MVIRRVDGSTETRAAYSYEQVTQIVADGAVAAKTGYDRQRLRQSGRRTGERSNWRRGSLMIA
jgi:hypothetical protein